MRRALVMLAALGLSAAASAAPAAAAARPDLPACRTSTHFVVHCGPGLSDEYLDGAIGSFEEAYAKDVAGGGGEPNAGLIAPIDDGDGHTDVYLMVPPAQPGFSGGIVYRDSSHVSGRGQAAYIFITPDMTASALRFRAAHEFMHVLLRAYFGMYGPSWEESLAN
jgi:hypothetical protein